ncbi:hypothetical protein [Phenylobacterium sp.]|uniref:hypothetical protein n=1 Tax=Phenylobacterium sp. TaxID=1871053 RepID=UPI002DEBAAF2|nr:hypothetical protein [Phenylobacterium sp.]
MAGFQPLMRPLGPFDDDDDIDHWMAQRNAEFAARDDAEAAGRQAWDQATRSGKELDAPQPGDLIRLGAQAIGGAVAAGESGANSGSDASATASPDADAPVERAQPVEPNGPLLSPPRFGFATARPGDSISKLLGTSDPASIGRFLSLNGMGRGGSTIYAGQSYAIPAGFDDVTPDEVATGGRTLRTDNSRLAASRAQAAAKQAADDLRQQRLQSGRNVWTGESVKPSNPSRETAPRQPARVAANWLDDSAVAKRAVGGMAELAGNGYGIVRGGVHTVQGAVGGAQFLAELPFSPSAQAEAAATGRRVGDYFQTRAAHPELLGDDAKNWLHSENLKLNPDATPMGRTMSGEVERRFGIGANQGETAFNIGSLIFGGEVAKGLEAAAVAREAPAVEASVRASHEPVLANYMLEPYEGMGAHWIARSTRLPKVLGGGRLPSWFIDSPFNVSKLEGATRWQQQKYHYATDLGFYGGPVRGRRGKGSGYSGEKLGWERFDFPGRVIAGMPSATTGLVGGAAAAALNSGYDAFEQGQPQ